MGRGGGGGGTIDGGATIVVGPVRLISDGVSSSRPQFCPNKGYFLSFFFVLIFLLGEDTLYLSPSASVLFLAGDFARPLSKFILFCTSCVLLNIVLSSSHVLKLFCMSSCSSICFFLKIPLTHL